ncbi:unnamed protein product [Ilex paraguariensis]|uniref:Uncharacterized protein n=1 Tax=Ilex paraguariensis TaxID=185542 RepID=A0ABC8TGW2_9AQUA
MGTELPPEIQNRKKETSRRSAAQKKPLLTVTEISDDGSGNDNDENDMSDDDFDLEEAIAPEETKKRGKKATKNVKVAKPPAAAKKRGQATTQQPQLRGQKLITEVLKPAENSGISPEKKVRKMRASPFNKKSGSVLGLIGKKDEEKVSAGSEKEMGSASSSDSIEEMSEVMAPRARTMRANRGKATYVVSDSESDQATDDSDFNEDED